MIFTLKNLQLIATQEKIEISKKEIQKLIEDIQNNSFTPLPVKRFELKKGDKTRPITILENRDKLVQKALNQYLTEIFNPTFSDKSYGYRPNKGALKAINRVSDFIKRGNNFVLKTDIKDFFETIDHDILKNILVSKNIPNDIIEIILLYAKVGAIDNIEYIEHNLGVYQGNIISPILSNIYLDLMDKFLEKHNFDFVRFADDFVILTKTKDKAEFIYRNLQRFLKVIKLSLNYEKTYITSVDAGFKFLGVYFTKKFRTIADDRIERIKEKISSYSNEDFFKAIEKLNFYYHTIKNYYLKISPYNKFLKSAVIDALTQIVYKAKLSKKINNKKYFRKYLSDVLFLDLFMNKDKTIELIITKAYNKTYSTDKKLEKTKRATIKKLTLQSIIHINQFGVSLSVSKGKFVIKKYGKVIKTFPSKQIKMIVLEGKGFSLSSDVLYKCAKENVFINFIDKHSNPYATISYYNAQNHYLIHKQALILNTPKHIELAREFLDGKLKNQKNYLIYLNRYHKNLETEIKSIKEAIRKLKSAKTVEEMMGIEGSSANFYWRAIGKVLEIEDFVRVKKGAKDKVNSSLNYAYAILYSKIQQALIMNGLSLNISFLHSFDNTKPTLVFDLIEEFRTFVVDRVIISMINKNEKISLNKDGFLTEESKKNIAKNIYEKLASFALYRKKSMKIENIIFNQALELKKAIIEDKKYNSFVGKF